MTRNELTARRAYLMALRQAHRDAAARTEPKRFVDVRPRFELQVDRQPRAADVDCPPAGTLVESSSDELVIHVCRRRLGWVGIAAGFADAARKVKVVHLVSHTIVAAQDAEAAFGTVWDLEALAESKVWPPDLQEQILTVIARMKGDGDA